MERQFYNQNDGKTYALADLKNTYDLFENDGNKEETFEKFLEVSLAYGKKQVGLIEI